MLIDYSPEVKDALEAKQAVVALESTIIAHGMPYPQNIETAGRLESIIRSEGAIPATIALLGGRIKIGLEEVELNYLAKAKSVVKASPQGLASGNGQKKWMLQRRLQQQ